MITQADKDRVSRFMEQDLTNGLAEEHLWRLVADVRAEAYSQATNDSASLAEFYGQDLVADLIRRLAIK